MRFPKRDNVAALHVCDASYVAADKYPVVLAAFMGAGRECWGHGGPADGVDGDDVVADEEEGCAGEEDDGACAAERAEPWGQWRAGSRGRCGRRWSRGSVRKW